MVRDPRSSLNTVASVRPEGEVGVQRDTQDLRGSVQQGHRVANSHLRVESGLMGVKAEQCHAGFQGSNGQLLSICPPHQRRAELVCPCICLHHARGRGQQWEVLGLGRHIKVGDGAVQQKMVKGRWWRHMAGRRAVLLEEEQVLPDAEVCHKPSNQIVWKSGAVDHLDVEAVKDCVKRLRDAHR